jgi:DNA invertase Pin-like site-specific DNA recombinase
METAREAANMKHRTLIPYLRQSRRREDSLSIDDQLRMCRSWAEANGVRLAEARVEKGVSGSKNWRERELGEAIAACGRGEADGVIVAWQDRLSRERGLQTAEVWEELQRLQLQLVCVGDGIDTTTGDHEFLFSIKAGISREQWKRFRANWEHARRNAVEAGQMPCRVVYGYRQPEGEPMQIDEAQAEQVRLAFRLRADGWSPRQIARKLGWAVSTTRLRLACDTYTGRISHGCNTREIPALAIVTEQEFLAVQGSKVTRPARTGSRTDDMLGVGIVRCAGCGGSMNVMGRLNADGSRTFGYYCKDRAKAACRARAYVRCDRLDPFLASWFEERMQHSPQVVSVLEATRDVEQAERQLAKTRDQLSKFLALDIDDAALSQAGIDQRQQAVREAEATLRQKAAHKAQLPGGGPLLTLWRDMTPLERRQVLAGMLDRVEVARGASGDLEGSVRIFWADGSPAYGDTKKKATAGTRQAASTTPTPTVAAQVR